MERNRQKDTELFLGNEELLLEIITALKDSFVAVFVKENEKSVLMRFINGRQFRLTLSKV